MIRNVQYMHNNNMKYAAAPGEGVTSHPSHPLDPPLSGVTIIFGLPGKHSLRVNSLDT